VSVRDHEIEHGFFYLDPCNLHPGEERIVADRIVSELEEARKRNAPEPYDLIARKVRRAERLLAWPD
jgi:L-seryl-tRNA(Ser) seleniumtransferase